MCLALGQRERASSQRSFYRPPHGNLLYMQGREILKCGVAVVDLRNGRAVAFLEFQSAVEEIFEVQLLPTARFPEVIGFQKEEIHHTFVVPPLIGS